MNDLERHLDLNQSGGKQPTEHTLENMLNPVCLAGLLSADTVPLTPQASYYRSPLRRRLNPLTQPVSAFKYSQTNKRVYVHPSLFHKMADAMAFSVGRLHGYEALMIGILSVEEERTLELLVRSRLGHPWDSGDRPRALPLIQAIRITVFVMSRPDALSKRQIAKIVNITHPTLCRMIRELEPVLQSIADEGAAIAARKVAA